MSENSFLKRLQKGIILFDGGMGTELYKKGVFINKCFEELNLSNPHLVRQVHQEFIKAGADAIETNTFGANRFKLGKFDLADKLYDINYQGAKIAKSIAPEGVFVAGAVGPLSAQIEPLGPISRDEAREFFKEQLKPLLDGGVDLFIFETFINHEELRVAVEAAREISDLPVIAELTIDEDATSLTGANPETVVKDLESIGADVIGVNCTVGPQVMLQWLEQTRLLTDMPIAIMPNAGKPKNIEGRNIYLTSPEYLGEYSKHYAHAGANIIGGCCGTGPEHIKMMRNMLNSVSIRENKIKFATKEEVSEAEVIPVSRKSRLARRMQDGRFVTFVEILSPHGVSAAKEIEKARQLYYYGIDVINIPDGPRASARMSSMAMAALMQREVGIETVLHYVCRDRNVIGIQSDLMGAYALGIRNILAITGDPPKLGNYPDATAVFDIDSIGLINVLNRLNHGLDIAGNPIGEPTGFYVGAGANPGAVNIEEELSRLKWKIQAGAEYIITQPVFDPEQFTAFAENIEYLKIPIVAGIWPLVSFRNAEFMNNELPGVNVPQNILDRMKKYEGDREGAMKEGALIANETLETIKKYIAGAQISAPFGKIEPVIDVLEGLR